MHILGSVGMEKAQGVAQGFLDDALADHVVLGNDAARRRYYSVFGGSPGLSWLLENVVQRLGAPTVLGLEQRLFVDNPARAFAFAEADR